MGFYGNISNINRTQFQFDKVYPNRKAMEQGRPTDGVYLGRFVLVEYDNDGRDGMKQIGEASLYNGTTNQYTCKDVNGQQLTWGNTYNKEVVYKETVNNNVVQSVVFYIRNEKPNNAADNGAATFTRINSGNETPYTKNHSIDKEAYQSSRGYDSTVWQKVYSEGTEKYVMIAELNTVVPTFDIATDAPTMVPVTPHFDTQSTDVYYKLHLQNPWVVRVAEAKNNAPSDTKTYWIDVEHNPDANVGEQYSTKLVEKDAAIYFNKAAFDAQVGEETINKTVSGENKITMDLVSSEKALYDDHNNTTSDPVTAKDIQELTINLPAIGNMMSDAWDIIHGPRRNDDMREIDPETGDYVASLKGRLDSIDAIADDEIPVKRHDNGQLIGSKVNGGKADEDDKTGIDDDAWIETMVDAATNTISIHHKFNRTKNGNTFIDLREADDWGHDTTDSIDMNSKEDSFDIVTPIVDDMGHIVGENTQTVTLPYGFKIIKTNGRSTEISENATGTPATADVIADNTKDELTINSGNKWIRIDTDVNGDSLTIRHDVHNTSSDSNTTDWTTTEANTTIPVVTYNYDEAGHYTSHHTENYKLPFGYGKIKGDSGNTAATATYDELTFTSDEWLTATVEKDKVTYSHDYPKKVDDTTSKSDVNGNGDTIILETLTRDEKGHVIKINQNTVTLPFGYKTFKDSETNPGQSIANSTQDIMTLQGDTWVKPTVSNDLIKIEHIGPVDVTATKVDDVTPKFGETFTITDWYYDNKGHKSNSNTHTVKIPLPSLTNGTGNVVTGLSLVPSTGALTETKNNISNLLLTDYSKKTDNSDISATDALGDALSKLQTQIHDTETVINNLDYSNESATQFISKITQTDGQIAVERAAAGTLMLGDQYKIAETASEITTADNINTAFGKLEKNLITEKANRENAIAKEIEDRNAAIAQAKKEILTGESAEELGEAYDTLLEISNWINGDGVNATELTEAIVTETSRAQAAENNLTKAISDETQARTEAFNGLKSAAYREEIYFVSKQQYDLDIATKDAQIAGLNTEAKRLTNEVKELQTIIEGLVDRIEALENLNNTEE